jgi:hypothetical protein
LISTGRSPLKRERRRRRQDAEVVRLLDVEQLRDLLLEQLPLVEAHAIDHHEQHPAAGFQLRDHELAADVHRQRRAVTARIRQPLGVVLRHEAREIVVQGDLEVVQRVLQAALVTLAQPGIPLEHLGGQLDPLPPTHLRGAALLQLTEPRHEVPRQPLLPDAGPLEQARHDREHLTGIHRLDQVVLQPNPDGLVHGAGFLALGHHDHGHRGIDGADLADQLEAPLPRKLLVQQDHAVRLAPQQRNGVVAVRRRLHLVPLLPEEQDVRLQRLDLVVHPEDGLGTGHGRNLDPLHHPDNRTWPPVNGPRTLINAS